VPARNEEEQIGEAVRSLAAQPEVGEVLVVNDASTDGTRAALEALAATEPKLRALEAPSLPDGWVGKNYAAALGAAEARGEWLLFTDADTTHLPGAAARALRDAERTGAALVSYSPEQETRTLAERALIPFIYVRLARHFSFAEVSNPESTAAAANGQFLLIRRDVYEKIGGHRAVAGEVLEDVALARRVKQAGHRIYFAPGQGIVRTRMYRSFGEMWPGWTKNLYPLMGGTGRAVLAELLEAVPWIPLAMLFGGTLHALVPAVGLLLLAGRHAAYALALSKNRSSLAGILYYLPASLLYAAVLLGSAARYARGTVVWKGREYPVGT
jgi:hypothetical protein